MKNNPIIPYILIMAFGIGLIFFLSMDGVGNKEEIANGGAETTENGGATAEGEDGSALVATCIGCHGGDLAGGGVGPKLIGLDPAYIEDVLVNGLEGSAFMTPNMKTPDEAKAIAEYISTLE